MDEPTQDFQLKDWVVRPQRLCLERGAEIIHIKPKSMAVLECLAQAGGAVVSRNELFDQVWPGAQVSDDVRTQSVVELRKAFGDSARSAQYIETIPKRGFRLLPPVMPPGDNASAGAAAGESAPDNDKPKTGGLRRYQYLALCALLLIGLLVYLAVPASRDPILTVEDIPTLVVLPFADMSSSGDQQYFADGLAEEVRNVLAGLKGLQVIGRTSAFSFRDQDLSLAEIAAALDVGHVLEGSVRRSTDRIRVAAQLVDAANGIVLWAEKYDRELLDVFAVQDEIARSVATALSIKLDVGDIHGLAGLTTSVEAYNEILQGQARYRQFTAESVLEAMDHFRRATDLDPQYAKAWERLGDIYCTALSVLEPAQLGGDWQVLSQQALERAMLLAPDSPEVLQTVAFRQVHLGQWTEAKTTLIRRAALLDSDSDSDDLTIEDATLQLWVGQLRKARQVLERERRLDPRSGVVSHMLTNVYREMGQFEAAALEHERGYQLGNFRPPIVRRGWFTGLTSGDRSLLREWMQRAWEVYPQQKGRDSMMLELIDDSPAALHWLRAHYRKPEIDKPWVATWAAYHGDPDFALEVAVDIGGWPGYWNPLFSEARRLDGFKQLVSDQGLVDYWREFGWGDYCRPVGETDFECQ
jgi:TolB-like protein/DNA-binding winged helix-turn-helix (wHTH) protein/Flp pilus assembly protein TadD